MYSEEKDDDPAMRINKRRGVSVNVNPSVVSLWRSSVGNVTGAEKLSARPNISKEM
jgi:hypothetical protein